MFCSLTIWCFLFEGLVQNQQLICISPIFFGEISSRDVFSELFLHKFHIYCKQQITVLLVTANTTTFLKKIWVRITVSQYTLKKIRVLFGENL